jgi:hypothetical protein
MSQTITIIGYTGQGKTLTTKALIKGKKALIFDVNNEYEGYGYCDKKMDKEKFLNVALQVKNTCIVFEDATGFFSGKGEDNLRRLLVNKRHTNNTYIFLFHSIQDTPPIFFRMSNTLVLCKTMDKENDIEKKASYLLPYFREVQKMPFTKNIYPNVSRKIIKLM